MSHPVVEDNPWETSKKSVEKTEKVERPDIIPIICYDKFAVSWEKRDNLRVVSSIWFWEFIGAEMPFLSSVVVGGFVSVDGIKICRLYALGYLLKDYKEYSNESWVMHTSGKVKK